MATLTYNGVDIAILRTNEIAMEPVRDVDGTYLYTMFRISVSGLVNPKAGAYSGSPPVAVASNPASDTITSIRSALLVERADLVYDVGDSDTPMIESPGDFPCDANNGPLPGPLTITRVDGNKTFHVSYSITTWITECPGMDGATPSALLSNRYSQSHQIDANHYTTITTSGQAFFRTDILENAQQIADDYRPVLLPPVPQGFKRSAINIAATPARNAITYQVVDVERPFDLGDTGPTGTNSRITDVKATYEVTSTGTRDGGPVSFMSLHRVSVMVWGSKAASVWTLTKFSFNVAQTKLPIDDPTKGFIRQISIHQSLTEKFVALNVTMQIIPQQQGQMAPLLATEELQQDDTFTGQQGLNPSMPGRGGTAGTYTNELMAKAWQSACSSKKGPPSEGPVGVDSGGGDVSSDTGPIVTTTSTADLPEVENQYSQAQTQAAYTDYKVDILHNVKSFTMQVPVSGPVAPTSPGNGGGASPPPPPPPPPGGSTGGGPGGGSLPSPEDIADGGDDGGDSTPECEFLTLARPMTRKVVEWTAERVGALPACPSSVPTDPNLVLIDDTHITVAEPSLLPDGNTLSYRVSGRYIYGLKKSLTPTTTINFPAVPWQSYEFGDNVLPGYAFVDGIIDDDGSSGESPGG